MTEEAESFPTESLRTLTCPNLEIQYPSGTVENLELSHDLPVSIGEHLTNDIQIAGANVAAIHCRISWRKTAYEVTSATSEGVDVNGSLVHTSLLKSGDVLSVGDVRIAFRDVNDCSRDRRRVRRS